MLVGQRFPRSITKFRVLSSAGEPQNNAMDEGGEVSENNIMDDGGEISENYVMGEISKYVAYFFTPSTVNQDGCIGAVWTRAGRSVRIVLWTRAGGSVRIMLWTEETSSTRPESKPGPFSKMDHRHKTL